MSKLTPLDTLRTLRLADGSHARWHALPALAGLGIGRVERLPVCLRIVLESLLRHVDGQQVSEQQVHRLADWRPNAPRRDDIPFIVARVLLQDYTGVPLLCDLAALRDAAAEAGLDAASIEPRVPVDLVIDHSVQVDHHRERDALDLNMRLEFNRNGERYRFIKWGQQAFRGLRVVPPGQGIVHQVNLEHLAPGVARHGDLLLPDTLVGTDSHTTMVNALGVLGWGVGGIEAEACMMGQPIALLTPDVVGVHLHGRLRAGVTATDLVLLVTERLRRFGVVAQFVEFHGEGAAALSLPDRATLANMAPEYGATVGYFPPDEVAANYLADTGRSAAAVDAYRRYFQAQQIWGMPRPGAIDYSRVLEIDLATVAPCVAGPRRPQDRIELADLPAAFAAHLAAAAEDDGQARTPEQSGARHRLPDAVDAATTVGDGDVLIAAITSCTNTANPDVMLTAGLLARQALARGLRVAAHVKTSLAPGSRVVTDYLSRAGLIEPLERLGFRVVAYGCTTCIGNAGPLTAGVEPLIAAHDLVGVAVLSGNRNFEARIHPALKANFLMSPPLVVAFALAGRIGIDLRSEPLGLDLSGRPVWLHELWPTPAQVEALRSLACQPQAYRQRYEPTDGPAGSGDEPAERSATGSAWERIRVSAGPRFAWEPGSTYIARPPFLDGITATLPALTPIRAARALAVLGDSVTTDHISPAGNIPADSPAGLWLLAQGVSEQAFNSYGARRGQHEVMRRGTFANVRLRNLLLAGGPADRPSDGARSIHQPDGRHGSIFDVAEAYRLEGVPLLVFAGEDYGSGSSRDWAAKGTRLLGVRAVIARSFERIHRANLIGMGVLPLQFIGRDRVQDLRLQGDETFDLPELEAGDAPNREWRLRVRRADGTFQVQPLRLMVETALEADCLRHGGILPRLLRQRLAGRAAAAAERPRVGTYT
ncbi:aconitate hydratase AcnA [Leptothrix discophora]|uniref:Aconitate hydratase n=1 Tax=Leptothrix discophora TaxID=89 RepID=A0ABT9G8J8_LEPDI|nr:aconitate hydratase AcnA [Leptothrix discophora]MDP4302797.1 aconitate hydratase AcnA [Leptothrix discophora]